MSNQTETKAVGMVYNEYPVEFESGSGYSFVGVTHAENATEEEIKSACDEAVKRIKIYDEITEERAYQDEVHGGPVCDDEHTHADWLSIAQQILVDIQGMEGYDGTTTFRQGMVQLAALAVAAIESYDRNQYDF